MISHLSLRPSLATAKWCLRLGVLLLFWAGFAQIALASAPTLMDGELVAEEMAVPEGLTPADWRAIRKNLPARPKALSDSAPQRAFLKASNADPGDRFGRSVAVWHNTVFVGAPREASDPALGEHDNSLYEAGAVYVFERSGSGWAQTAMLKASNAEDNGNLRFGISLAVEQDTLVVGAD
ncbi:MAG: hypothetical protein ABI299_13720, partial [Rhodanobacter sp.]